MAVCVGVHVPKCAGTTILKRVESCLPEHKIYQNTSMHENFMLGRPEIMQLPRRDQLKFVWGHSIHEEMLKYFKSPVFLFTGLREPKARLESMYLYHLRMARSLGNEPLSLERFLGYTSDPICQFFIHRFPTFAGSEGSLFERARRVIDLFDHVYFSENLEAAADIVFRRLDISPEQVNHNQRPADEKGKSIEIPEGNTAQDIKLYEYAQAKFGGAVDSDEVTRRSGELDAVRKERLQGWPQEERLAEFLYGEAFKEYRDWGDYQHVVSTRMNQMRALSLELATYARFAGR